MNKEETITVRKSFIKDLSELVDTLGSVTDKLENIAWELKCTEEEKNE